MKNSPDGKALIALIDRSSEDKTMENFQKYERPDKSNYIYGLFYFQHIFYSYQALKGIRVDRKGSSDLLKVSYQSGDPGTGRSLHSTRFLLYQASCHVLEYNGSPDAG